MNRIETFAMQHSRIRTGFLIAGLLLALGGGSTIRAGGGSESGTIIPEPAGYRMDEYRAATPTTLSGGTVLNTTGVQELLKLPGTVLIDVLPEQKRPDNLPANTLWIPKGRFNIPGSTWLPDVGRGALNESVEAYYKNNLERLTGADRGRKIVVYCLARCWMSWNAAKRAIEYGYTSVYWYPGGTDDWTAAGLPTEESQAVPMDSAVSTTN